MKNRLAKKLFYTVVGIAVSSFLAVKPAMAHHGGASAAFGPGAPVETTAPLTLPDGMWLIYNRFELAKYKKFYRNGASVRSADNIDRFTFNTSMLGYGVTDALSAYLILPYAMKTQDRVGTSTGLGDIELLLQYGFKYGVKDGIAGWYIYNKDDTAGKEFTRNDYKFTLFGGFSMPTGTTSNWTDVDDDGDGRKDTFGMGMQPGFATPSFTLGIAGSKMLIPHLTLTADTSIKGFSQHNDGRPGNETRANLALGYEIFESKKCLLTRVDLIGEANFLHLDRDQDGDRIATIATGGNILYLSPAVRLTFNNLSIGIMCKFPSLLDLNKQNEQQGAEGLEKYRFIVSASLSF